MLTRNVRVGTQEKVDAAVGAIQALVRVQIIRHARTRYVGKSQPCMVYSDRLTPHASCTVRGLQKTSGVAVLDIRPQPGGSSRAPPGSRSTTRNYNGGPPRTVTVKGATLSAPR